MSELNITRNDLGNNLSFKGRPQKPRYIIKLGNGPYIQSVIYQNFRWIESTLNGV